MTEDTNTGSAVVVEGMSRCLGDFQALCDIDLTVNYGERVVICGPSGSRKSTLIRCLNQLETRQKGTVVVNSTELSKNTKNIEDVRRNIGMVFQSLNLFPHLSVLDDCVLAQRRLNNETKFIIKESPCFVGVKSGEMPMLQWVNVFILHKKLGGRLNAMSQKWFG